MSKHVHKKGQPQKEEQRKNVRICLAALAAYEHQTVCLFILLLFNLIFITDTFFSMSFRILFSPGSLCYFIFIAVYAICFE